MDLYSHVTDTMQADAAARLDAAFQTAKTRAEKPKLGRFGSNFGSIG